MNGIHHVKTNFSKVMPPESGLAIEVMQGQHLRITDIEGPQVVDMAVFNLENLREKLSTSNSRNRYFHKPGMTYTPRDHLEEGDWLMSTLCRPLMRIVKETPRPKGVHDSLNRMCDRFLYEVLLGIEKDGCHEIISKAVAKYGLLPEDIPDTFDLFMNYPHTCEKGHFEIRDPVAKAGDYVELRAEMNALVGLSNCPYASCNAGLCKPVLIEVLTDENYRPTPVRSPADWRKEELRRTGFKP